MSHHFTDSLIESYQQLTEANTGEYKSPYLNLDKASIEKASKAFNYAYDNKLLDLTAFHRAYDKELADADMLGLFNSEGLIKQRNFYGQLKEYPNQGAFFIIAAKRLWGMQFSEDRFKFKTVEQAEAEKKQKEDKRQKEKRQAEERKQKERAFLDYLNKINTKLAELKKIVLTKIDQKLLAELKAYVSDPELQEPYLRYWYNQDDFEKNNGTQAELRVDFRRPDTYRKYIPAQRKQIIQDPLNLTEAEMQTLVQNTNELISEFIKNILDAKLPERKNLIEHKVFGKLGFKNDREYIIKDNNEYFKIKGIEGSRDNYAVSCFNYNTKSEDIPVLSDQAELYGACVSSSQSSRGSIHSIYYSWDKYEYMSWNSHLPKEILDELGWANYHDNSNYISGSVLKPVSKNELEKYRNYNYYFYTSAGIDRWSYEHRYDHGD